MDDQAGHAASESAGEFRDQGAALLVQEIGVAVQVDHRQAGMGRHEFQNMIKFTWRVGVHLGGQARLGETEPSEPQERVVACDTSLEQGMNGLRHQTLPTWPVTIHDLHLTRSQLPASITADCRRTALTTTHHGGCGADCGNQPGLSQRIYRVPR